MSKESPESELSAVSIFGIENRTIMISVGRKVGAEIAVQQVGFSINCGGR